jgi:fused signal recognition particle receptor
VFKRLREGLFGRTEQEEAQQPAPVPAEADQADNLEEQVEQAAPPVPLAPAEDEVISPPAPAIQAEPPRAAPPGVPIPQVPPTVEPMAEPVPEEQVEEEPVAVQEERGGFFRNPFRLSLGRTRQLFGQMNATLEDAEEISDELWDELEEALLTSDVGVQVTDKLMATLHERVVAESMTRGAELRDALKEELEILLGEPEPLVFSDTSPISVYLVVGVNGVGKTTSIAKLGNLLKRQKHRVMLAAGDTFRAAAVEQLKMWGERVGVPVIAHQQGADPGAVVYDAMEAAQARNTDVLIVDTAGRLHTKYNLMEELKKIVKVLQKYDPEAPHEVLLVIDATTGQNGYLQAKQFVQDSGVSGVILTKLDGTARGGIVFTIASELGLPIKYVGTGEKVNDIAPFDAQDFVDALFEE